MGQIDNSESIEEHSLSDSCIHLLTILNDILSFIYLGLQLLFSLQLGLEGQRFSLLKVFLHG